MEAQGVQGKLGLRTAAGFVPQGERLLAGDTLLAGQGGRKSLHRGPEIAVLRGREMKGRHVRSQPELLEQMAREASARALRSVPKLARGSRRLSSSWRK